MERIFIDREWCINCVLLTLKDIEDSKNKEKTINEFITEIRKKFDVYEDEIRIKQIEKEVLKKIGKKRVMIGTEEK